jgi:molybdate transport system substrate-binding protein
MKHIKLIAASAALLLLAATLSAAQVTVFAAASLTEALKQIAAAYEKSSGDKIVFNFAASGVLARQIQAGAPAEIFFSADEAQLDIVAAKGLLVPGSRRNLLGNSLVLVTGPENANIHSPSDLTNAAVQRIALGDPKTVPAGTYAKSYLEKIGCWSALQPKIIPCENVRAVLAVIESGNADAGFIYQSDAAISKKAKVAYEVPVADAPKIVYPAALVKTAQPSDAAAKFLSYLSSDSAAGVFRAFGFQVLAPSTSARPQPSSCTADFQVCCIAGFQTHMPSASPMRSVFSRPADLEIGEPKLGLPTAGLETCGTMQVSRCAPTSPNGI